MIAIYCAGSLGKEISGMIEFETNSDIVFIDDVATENIILGHPRVSYEKYKEKYCPEDGNIIIATGEPIFRESIRKKLENDGYALESFISKMAYVNKDVRIGAGVVIFPNTYISYGVEIKDNTIIHANCQIEADLIGSNCFCSVGVFVGANACVGDTNFIGPHAVIRDNLMIGDNNIIGMNSVVLKDVLSKQVLVGNPARILRENTEGIVFKKK